MAMMIVVMGQMKWQAVLQQGQSPRQQGQSLQHLQLRRLLFVSTAW